MSNSPTPGGSCEGAGNVVMNGVGTFACGGIVAYRTLIPASAEGSLFGSLEVYTPAGANAGATSEAQADLANTAAIDLTIFGCPAADPLSAIAIAGGVVSIDWAALQGPVFFAPPSAGSGDPFYFVHTDPAVDGFFLSIEAYTTGYGTAWTGELGSFAIDCTPDGTGICVHFDPDGPGPIGDLGADFAVAGEITFIDLGTGGFVADLKNVTFSDGTVIPGPVRITG